MNSVVVTYKKTGKAVEVRLQVSGTNCTPSATEWHADARRVAIDDRLISANADTDDYDFEIAPVCIPAGCVLGAKWLTFNLAS